MKIQNINNYINNYNNTKPIKNEKINISKKYDVIDIKSKKEKTSEDTVSLNNIKKQIVNDITKETNADKVSKIKNSINNNTYKIDVDEIVRKILY